MILLIPSWSKIAVKERINYYICFTNPMYEIREAKEEDRESAIRVLWKAFDVTEKIEEVRKEAWAQGWHKPEKETEEFC